VTRQNGWYYNPFKKDIPPTSPDCFNSAPPIKSRQSWQLNLLSGSFLVKPLPLLVYRSIFQTYCPGASQDPKKYGNIILRWYIDHKLPVHPINPTASSIESLNVVKDVSSLPSPTTTSLSFLTQPAITLKSLQEAQRNGVQRVWLQPGSFDEHVLKEAESMGFETVIANGRCILREGEKGLNALKRESKAWNAPS